MVAKEVVKKMHPLMMKLLKRKAFFLAFFVCLCVSVNCNFFLIYQVVRGERMSMPRQTKKGKSFVADVKGNGKKGQQADKLPKQERESTNTEKKVV